MRKYWRIGLVTLCLALAASVPVLNHNHTEGCFPENNLHISSFTKSSRGMKKETFNHIIDVIEEIYSPIIAEMGGELQIERKWTDGTVNAYAQRIGKIYRVSMFGGLARHETITPDAFAYVVCHEIGHHIGGAPKNSSWRGISWASNEGQSDYWGGNKCLKRVFQVLEEYKLNKKDPDYKFALAECNRRYGNAEDEKICLRTAMAGKSLAELFRVLRRMNKELHFYTRDNAVVKKTYNKHPMPQCRMDTYLASALCEKSYDEEISDIDADKGFCIRKESFKLEARPLCWFKPQEEVKE